MNELNTSFARFDQIVPLIHILSVIFFVCAQICIVVIAHIFIRKYDVENSNFDKIIGYIAKFNLFFLLFFAMVGVSGFVMSLDSDFKFADPMVRAVLVTLWVLMAFIMINFLYMHYKFRALKKAIESNDYFEAGEHLIIIVKYFIPLNIAVTLVGVYLGVTVGKF